MIKIKIEDYKKSAKIQETYAKIANQCNETGCGHFEEKDGCYVLIENPEYSDVLKQKLASELLIAQLDGNQVEEISPTTYMNVMIKL